MRVGVPGTECTGYRGNHSSYTAAVTPSNVQRASSADGVYRSFWMPHFFRFSQSDFRVIPSMSASVCSLHSYWYRMMNAFV